MQVEKYQYKNVAFIVTPNKIAVQTGLQFFILQPIQPSSWKRMKTIRMLISNGVIQDVGELSNYCTGKVMWVTSREEWLR